MCYSDSIVFTIAKYNEEIHSVVFQLVTVNLRTDAAMIRRGNDEANAVVRIWSFGVFDEQRNPQYVKDLYAFLLPALNITPDRFVGKLLFKNKSVCSWKCLQFEFVWPQ